MATTQSQKMPHTGGGGLFFIGVAFYLALTILFAYQTWQFVNWLFPADQIIMRILTVVCFDLAALFWGALEVFYAFATPGSRALVRWAWGISFILSTIATIFYMVIESMFRFNLALSQQTVDIGYAVVIFAVVLNLIFLTFFILLEYVARHPHRDHYELYSGVQVIEQAQTGEYPIVPRQLPQQTTMSQDDFIRALQAAMSTNNRSRSTNKPFLAPARQQPARPLKKLPRRALFRNPFAKGK